MRQLYFFFLLLLPDFAVAQTCDCCNLRSKGQKKYDAGDWAGAKATWQNAGQMPDAANCTDLPALIKKAEKAIRDARDRDRDGVPDVQDDCPDSYGIKANKGCPEQKKQVERLLPTLPSDRDHDGILDLDDQCPDTAGTAALRGCPDLKDDDEDGTPNAQDECPTSYGPKQLKGCPDRDFDGIPDLKDTCQDQAGPMNTAGCPDRDADGVADKFDQCPDQPGSKTLAGCPDQDNDKVIDASDDCPDLPGLKRFNGCPDKDFDETPDPKDGCPDTAGPKTAFGCPDRDADGVADKDDLCPDQFGTADNKGCPVPPPTLMTHISGGSFTMGDCFGDGDTTQHSVTLSEFYIGTTEVTFDEFDAFCVATSREKPGDEGWGRGQHPVINVDWYDALEYCNWLSQQAKLTHAYTIDKTLQDTNNTNTSDTKKYTVTVNWAASGYRLPTEAEWEYAAREGGKKVRFGNGKDIADPAQINFNGSVSFKEDYSVTGVYRQKTVPVGDLNGAANSLGLRHMSGNVYEWCHDWYGDYNKNGSTTDPNGTDSGSSRVVRGGCWYYFPDDCRSAKRYLRWPIGRYNYVGFRVVRHL